MRPAHDRRLLAVVHRHPVPLGSGSPARRRAAAFALGSALGAAAAGGSAAAARSAAFASDGGGCAGRGERKCGWTESRRCAAGLHAAAKSTRKVVLWSIAFADSFRRSRSSLSMPERCERTARKRPEAMARGSARGRGSLRRPRQATAQMGGAHSWP